MSKRNQEDERELSIATYIFSAIGLNVSRIPKSNHKTCDLLLTDVADIYHVEVKMKYNNNDFINEMKDREIVYKTKPLGYYPTLAKKIAEAEQQIFKTQEINGESFGLVFLMVDSTIDKDTFEELLFSTIYGARSILYGSNEGYPLTKRCLYFRDGAFKRSKHIDALIVCYEDVNNFSTMLFLNEFSLKKDSFTKSKVYKFCSSLGSYFDPSEEKGKNNYFIIDKLLPIDDINTTLEYLVEKYGIFHVKDFVINGNTAYTSITP